MNLVCKNTSAKRILDSVSFSHPGMHLHMPRVILQRLKDTITVAPSIRPTTRSCNKIKKNIAKKSNRVLLSTRIRQDFYSDSDDEPLITTHRYNLRSGSRKRKLPKKGKGRRKPGTLGVAVPKKAKIIKPNEKNTEPVQFYQDNAPAEPSTSQAGQFDDRGEDKEEEMPPLYLESDTDDDGASWRMVGDMGQNNIVATPTFLIELFGRDVPGTSSEATTARPFTALVGRDVPGTSSEATTARLLTDPLQMPSYCSVAKVETSVEPSSEAMDDEDDLPDVIDTLIDYADIGDDDSPIVDCLNQIQVRVKEEGSNVETAPQEGGPNVETAPQEPSTEAMDDEDDLPDVIDTLIDYADIGDDDSPIAGCLNQIQVRVKEEGPNVETAPQEGGPNVETAPQDGPNVETAPQECRSRMNTQRDSHDAAEIASSGGCRIGPTFYPSESEFKDPIQYYIKIAAEAAQYGICKVVAPPNFQPQCVTAGLDKIVANSQYPGRFYRRWGEGTQTLCAMKTYLASHGVRFLRPPLVGGLEVNLPKMFNIVQRLGGFTKVSLGKKWTKVAEEMNIKLFNPEKKLDQIHVKYMLPYDILTDEERNTLNAKVESRWHAKQQLLQKRADNPLHSRKVFLDESEESSDEGELSEEETNLRDAILDAEECVKQMSRQMTLPAFRKVSNTALQMNFPNGEPTVDDIESGYWRMVHEATDHVSVYTASVDTSESIIGFTTNPTDPMSRHPWNLKNIHENDANILRSLGDVVSITIPIVHFGMVFSTNCWHRDPHGLPWMEYLHEGRVKIWYGIPDQQSDQFRRAVERVCPTSVQNKTIWLPSDITMIPPELLLKEGVSLTKLTQRPGEFIFVFPKAYSSSICTDFTISESVYFAVQPWPTTLPQVFQELRDSCEPMMFALEQLLIAIARDERVSQVLHQQILPQLVSILEDELSSRFALIERGIPAIFVGRKDGNRPYNVNEELECNMCRRPLYLSQVKIKSHHEKLKQVCAQDAQLMLTKLECSKNPKPVDMVLETLISDSGLRRILSTGQKKFV